MLEAMERSGRLQSETWTRFNVAFRNWTEASSHRCRPGSPQEVTQFGGGVLSESQRVDLVDLLGEVRLLLLVEDLEAGAAHQRVDDAQVAADAAVHLVGDDALERHVVLDDHEAVGPQGLLAAPQEVHQVVVCEVGLGLVQELLRHVHQVHAAEQRQQQPLADPADAGAAVQSARRARLALAFLQGNTLY
ncbi:hypothetical protein EYF80_056942 [Liparis tanakae]|uniref:Uncharacterized protein n=1 Tax=Liparis tanakae TaxID=230148 RepID=A0A4Z2EX14_9TELE|nr:hypothetical protein EYF80_056942 [Liparis tanakae]